MAKLTQKERRLKKKEALVGEIGCLNPKVIDNNGENRSCSICLDVMDDKDCISLSCGHSFHKSCSQKWNFTQSIQQMENNELRVIAPLGETKGVYPVLVYENGQGAIQCAVCRAEYDMISTARPEPQRIICKVHFAEDEDGNTHTHNITRLSELRHYTPKHCKSYKNWKDMLDIIIYSVLKQNDTDLYPMRCNCARSDCDGFFLLNEKMLEVARKGGFNSNIDSLEHINITELPNNVKDLSVDVMKRWFA